MLYRFKECLSRKQCSQPTSNAFLYRGVTKSLAERDLDRKRLYFSRAIIHDEDMQECEMFRTYEERDADLKRLGLGSDSLTSKDQRSKEFFERADKFYVGMTYISSWSSTREAALDFAQPLHDRALLRISQADLVQCLQSCFYRWNSLQPGEYEMLHSDGGFRDDWSPRAVRYAYGKVDYPDRAECNTASPFRLSRAMRLPGGSQDGNLEREDEWRISLDLSEVFSSIQTERMVRTGLLAKELGNVSTTTNANDLETMIALNGQDGLWLNDLHLLDAGSFVLEGL